MRRDLIWVFAQLRIAGRDAVFRRSVMDRVLVSAVQMYGGPGSQRRDLRARERSGRAGQVVRQATGTRPVAWDPDSLDWTCSGQLVCPRDTDRPASPRLN